MKKKLQELRQKDLKELIKEKQNMKNEIAKLSLEKKVNVPKDSNEISKKRKKIAQILTIIQEKSNK